MRVLSKMNQGKSSVGFTRIGLVALVTLFVGLGCSEDESTSMVSGLDSGFGGNSGEAGSGGGMQTTREDPAGSW